MRHRQAGLLEQREALVDHVRVAAQVGDVAAGVGRERLERDLHAAIAVIATRLRARRAAEARMEAEARVCRGERLEFVAQGNAGRYRIACGSRLDEVDGARLAGGMLSARINGEGRLFGISLHADRIDAHDGERRLSLQPVAMYRHEAGAGDHADDRVRAPMPGRVVAARVQPGDRVVHGQELLVMEAMKMELALKAPRDGTVAELRAQAGDFVEADSVLVVLDDPG